MTSCRVAHCQIRYAKAKEAKIGGQNRLSYSSVRVYALMMHSRESIMGQQNIAAQYQCKRSLRITADSVLNSDLDVYEPPPAPSSHYNGLNIE